MFIFSSDIEKIPQQGNHESLINIWTTGRLFPTFLIIIFPGNNGFAFHRWIAECFGSANVLTITNRVQNVLDTKKHVSYTSFCPEHFY